jgi:hypothetical protein
MLSMPGNGRFYSNRASSANPLLWPRFFQSRQNNRRSRDFQSRSGAASESAISNRGYIQDFGKALLLWQVALLFTLSI